MVKIQYTCTEKYAVLSRWEVALPQLPPHTAKWMVKSFFAQCIDPHISEHIRHEVLTYIEYRAVSSIMYMYANKNHTQ
jgi:hypothetical protein